LRATPEEPRVPEIRVVMAMAPPLLADMVGELLARERDIRLVGEVANVNDLPARVRETEADVVVMAAEDEALPPGCRALLTEFPELHVVTVEAGATKASLRCDGNPPLVFTELSPAHLLSAIRQRR
jgi:DNA-binding NarL/FixJ family response regulator